MNVAIFLDLFSHTTDTLIETAQENAILIHSLML